MKGMLAIKVHFPLIIQGLKHIIGREGVIKFLTILEAEQPSKHWLFTFNIFNISTITQFYESISFNTYTFRRICIYTNRFTTRIILGNKFPFVWNVYKTLKNYFCERNGQNMLAKSQNSLFVSIFGETHPELCTEHIIRPLMLLITIE